MLWIRVILTKELTIRSIIYSCNYFKEINGVFTLQKFVVDLLCLHLCPEHYTYIIGNLV